MDVYVYRSDLNQTWQVNPMNNVKTCFQTDGEVDLISYIPDTTGFVQLDDAVQIDDTMCDVWQLQQSMLQSTSTYSIYVSRQTGKLMRYTVRTTARETTTATAGQRRGRQKRATGGQ